MSILDKLSKFGAAALLATSMMTLPAVAQPASQLAQSVASASVTKVNFQNRSNFRRGNRGNFRGNRRGNFRGNSRSNFRGNSRSSFRGTSRSSFRGTSRSGFRGTSRSNFRGNRRGSFRGTSRRGFRGNSFRRSGFGFNNRFGSRGFFGSSFGTKVVVASPLYAVGGFYGVTNNTIFISDFGAHGLYAPPRGHHWVCDKGSNDAVLVAIATGAIVAVAVNSLLTPY